MAVFKKKKGDIRQGGNPNPQIHCGGDPNSIYKFHPSWAFLDCDIDENITWAFCEKRLANDFWSTVFPKLREFESMTWAQILIDGKKQNHSISPNQLNKCARDRLAELHIEAESIYSLRLGGAIRIYGYIERGIYHILWYDTNHGDNIECVCRSYLKNT